LCIEATLGRFDTARTAGEKAARLREMAGAERSALVVAANRIELAMEVGDNDGAIAMGRSLSTRLCDSFHSEVRGIALGVLSAALTARGDLDESLAIASEAAPFLRDEGMLFWLFDHLALRAALAGRVKVAALIAGYADAVHETFARPREPMGRRAVARTTALLGENWPEPDIAALARLGTQLSEDQALTLALEA
jgi:hypothetical protein